MSAKNGPRLVSNGLVLYLDSFNNNSYPGTGNIWYDISPNNFSGSLINNPIYSNNNITFDGIDDYVSIPETNLTGEWTVSALFRYDYRVLNQTIFNLLMSTSSDSGQIAWYRSPFTGITCIHGDSNNNLYFGTFGMGIWNDTPRWFCLKLDSSGSLDESFNINYSVGSAVNQSCVYIGNDGYLYTSGTNLNFFAKRNKDTGTYVSGTSGNASSINAYFVIDEDNRKVYHKGTYTTAFSLERKYICKFDLDSYEVDTIFDTSNGLNAEPETILLTSDKYLYAVGASISSYKGTNINHIVRLNQSGNLDTSFNSGGGFNDAREIVYALDANNKLICAGRYFTSYSGSACNRLIRINTDGTIDTSFINYEFGGFGRFYSVKVQNDGKILISGYFSTYSGSSCAGLVRLNSDGTYDNAFNVGSGISDVNRGLGLHIQNDGKIIIGQSNPNTPLSYNNVSFKTFMRLDISGSIDYTFDTSSGFTDSTSRSEMNIRIRNSSGVLTTVYNFSAWPSLGGRQSPDFYRNAFNDWKYATFIKDSTNTLKLYINGSLVFSTAFSTASYQNLDLKINKLITSNNVVNNIAIYNRVLSEQEIQQNFYSIKGRVGI